MTQLGISGFLESAFSSEETMPTNITAHVDVGRFLSDKWVVRVGLSGSGSFGGDEARVSGSGAGVPSLYGFGGLSYYFTPDALMSAYAGADYSTQITNRADGDRGSVVGKLGLQMAVMARLGFFVEAGYGMGLTTPDSNVRQQRFVGALGFRFTF